MKTLCCSCNNSMEYERHEAIDEGSIGIVFTCDKCGNRIRLITNPGETMLVHAMGVKIGGPEADPAPLELTRSSLLAEGETTSITWSAGARERVEKIPPFVRPFVAQSIEDYGLERGHTEITEEVLDEYKAVRGHM